MSEESEPTEADQPGFPGFDRLVRADVRLIAALRAELYVWLGIQRVRSDDRDAVVLAVSEAIANAIEHGYRDEPDGLVHVAAGLSDGRIEVTVRDAGSWVAMRRHPDRGRGLTMIEKLMDWSEVSTGRGTTVSMWRQVVIETA